MKTIFITFTTIICLLLSIDFVIAQDEEETESTRNVVKKETSYLFDSYKINEISHDDETLKLESFAVQLKNIGGVSGRVYVYRGANDYDFDAEKYATKLAGIFDKFSSIPTYQFSSRFSGFRENSEVEMIVEPFRAEVKGATPTISLLDVKFYNDTKLAKNEIQKTGRELLDSIVKKLEPPFPPAAKAVRAFGEVGTLIKIDEKGNVITSTAFLGHPLLRAACVAATKQWQFKPEKRNGVQVKVIGIAVCEFKLEDE